MYTILNTYNIRKKLLAVFALAFFVYVPVHAVNLQTCGQGSDPTKACTLDQLVPAGKLSYNTIGVLVLFGTILFAAVTVGLRIASGRGGSAAILSDGKIRLAKILTGVIILLLATYFVKILLGLGFQKTFLPPTSIAPVSTFFTHAYAADSTAYASPVGNVTLTSFMVLALKIFVAWFVFPFLIGVWLFAGFRFVAAQGNPTKIAEAKMLLFWAFLGTVVLLGAETFASALKETVFGSK